MDTGQLPLWHFFHEIEKMLSYERWIDKYQLFVKALLDSSGVAEHEDWKPVIVYDEDWIHLKKFIKFLYLQDIRDEQRFDQLLNAAIYKERELLISFLQPKAHLTNNHRETKPETTPPPKDAPAKSENTPPSDSKTKDDSTPNEKQMDEPPESAEGETKYYQPPGPLSEPIESISSQASNYLQTDEYFPVTRRQMIKGCQFLRLKERGVRIENIDIPSTITQIAKEGLFLQPQYSFSHQNRLDTLIIFADYRGSMTPFHELTNRLIQTARTEGGHPRAPVFYFQNYPIGYVYRLPNLARPVKIKEALIKANRNFTLAIVISDAGAARGSTDKDKVAARTRITSDFLDDLNTYCAHTIWLNPMPNHRWKDTAAMYLKNKVMLMAPILDQDTYNFQDTLRTILKQTYQF